MSKMDTYWELLEIIYNHHLRNGHWAVLVSEDIYKEIIPYIHLRPYEDKVFSCWALMGAEIRAVLHLTPREVQVIIEEEAGEPVKEVHRIEHGSQQI
jgi:hypothetical protein